MSRISRDFGDVGDRTEDSYSTNLTRRARIRFLDARTFSDWKISLPCALAEKAVRGGKHRDSLLFELAILWRRYKKDGEFRVSMRMLDKLYTAAFRKKLKAILDQTATPKRTHSSYPSSARCRTYKFNIRRPKTAPSYGDIPEDFDCPESLDGVLEAESDLTDVKIPATWLWDRYERWTSICERNDWTSSLDLDGRTKWGRPLFSGIDKASIPKTKGTARLTERGVIKLARRIRGRCYHPMTNLRRDLRRESLIDGEPAAEVDLHCSYTCFLVSKLPDGEAKDKAIAALRSDWYAQFKEAFDEWFRTQIKIGKGYINESGQWMLRLDDDPEHDTPASIKVEYQRQCLFWRDRRCKSSPLRVSLRRLHPELCQLMERWRWFKTPTQLSDVLTRAEGDLVVDSLLAELERAGIAAIPIHDAVLVPASQAEAARETMLRVCERHLGFRPRVSIKASVQHPS